LSVFKIKMKKVMQWLKADFSSGKITLD